MTVAEPVNEVDVDQELLAEVRDHVLWLTLNRPDAGNAITPAVRNRMIEHLNEANGSFEVRAIVLTAVGEKHFCTGADLRTGRATPPPKPEGAPERVSGEAARMIRTGIQRLIGAQAQICSRAPLAVLLSRTSRHLPLARLTRAPEAFSVHFWVATLS